MKFALNNRALIASSTVFAVLLALICLTNYNNVSAVTKKITDKASCEAAKAIWINAYESKGTGAYTTSGPGCFKTEQVQTSIGAQTKYVRITEYEDTSAADAEQNAKVAEDNSSCKVTGVGWIVCNVVQYIADTVEGLYQKIMDILFQVDADMFTGKDVLNAWGSMRDIANVAMVVVFLFVIF